MKKAFQTYILQRYFTASKLTEFLEEYNGARIHSGREKRQANDLDREIYKKYKKGELLTDLAREYGRSYYWVWKAIRLVAEEIARKK